MTNNSYETYTLPNGLRILYGNYPSDITYCGIAINAGTRDENPDEFGAAHFIEHMLFKGTDKRKAHHIVSRMENVGGDLNAFTTKEETFIYATFLSQYYQRAMELLEDLVFHSTFPQIQIVKEREVILDEINSYNDAPSELIYDEFENLIFKNHELGHYILGDTASLKNIDTDILKNFVARQYTPSNMVFFYFGNTPFNKVVKYAEKIYYTPHVATHHLTCRTKPDLNLLPQRVEVKKPTSLVHCMMGNPIFGFHHPERYNAVLLNHLLGGANMSSRLNVALREKLGLVYTVESAINFYSDCGVFNIYFSCDEDDLIKCENIIYKEVNRLKNGALSTHQLNVVKRKVKGELAISCENKENLFLGMVKNFLHKGDLKTYDETLGIIDAISKEDLLNSANKIWKNDSFSTIIFAPE